MRKPIDPRKHGLKEPEKCITKHEVLSLPTLSDAPRYAERRYPLEATVNMWLKALKDHNNQGHAIVESPYIENSFLRYSYQYENLNYDVEMSCYSAALNEYAEECRKFAAYEEGKKNRVDMKIDEKIERTERRLANLKAIKSNEPLPFPEGSDVP